MIEEILVPMKQDSAFSMSSRVSNFGSPNMIISSTVNLFHILKFDLSIITAFIFGSQKIYTSVTVAD